MKQNIIRIILIAILLADMIFIFSNSAQNATSSASVSQSITEKVAPIILPNYREMNEEEQKQAVLSLDAILREIAHMLQFVPLGFALYLLLHTFSEQIQSIKLKLLITISYGIFYAITDEIHQIFSPGRAFEFFDIFMDTCGVVAGCAAAVILTLVLKRIPKQRV